MSRETREEEFRRQTLVSQLDERRPTLGYVMAGVGVIAAVVSGAILFRAPSHAPDPVSSTTLASAPMIPARTAPPAEPPAPASVPGPAPAKEIAAEDAKPKAAPRAHPRAASRTKPKAGANGDIPPPSTEVDIPLPEFVETKPAKVDPPKVEASKADAPKVEPPKTDAPKADMPAKPKADKPSSSEPAAH